VVVVAVAVAVAVAATATAATDAAVGGDLRKDGLHNFRFFLRPPLKAFLAAFRLAFCN